MSLSAEAVREFEQTMPKAYRKAFSDAERAAHASIVAARGSQAARVARFEARRGEGWALCVVADDRPGLLATISAALVEAQLDVVDAEAYTRRVPAGRTEAVDVFWVRHSEPERRASPVSEAELLSLEQVLLDLLLGRRDPRATPVPSTGPIGVDTIVRFIESEAGDLSTLEVETGDRSGLLLALSNALYALAVQIVGSEVRTKGARVFDRFQITELDGSPIGAERRLAIQVAVISAVQPIR